MTTNRTEHPPARGTGAPQPAAAPLPCPPPGEALRLSPPLAGRSGDWLRDHPLRLRRLGRPGLASPWRTCGDGCCLVLHGAVPPHAAAQWLRILLAAFEDEGHTTTGHLVLPGRGAQGAVVLSVENGEVAESVLDVGA
ncbi:MAG: hypothetical protein ACI379_11050 [Nocardioides sp.]|uniref:hypothetical protein n=1 Tax=Nocardioides sp. TaxID=35761 RepID=UPI003F12066B